MATTYHPYKIALTDGQEKKLKKAYISKTAVALRVKPEQIGRGDELLLTATQISRVKKTAAAGKGLELNLSQTQIQSTAQRGGNLFSAMPSRAEGSGVLGNVAMAVGDLAIQKGIPFLAKKGLEAGRYYASEALRDPNLQKKAIDYTLDKARPVFQNVGSEMLDQISTKVHPDRR